ncbi:MAG TPA: leucyl aminopeptidase [Rhodocyclaceae bacterium]|nr:leucyl aminopeptidase [Rhodocyclaceae bacterium]
MEFSIKSGSPEKQRCGGVVVGVYESRKLTLAAELLDKAADGYLSEILRRGDLDGKTGSTLVLHNVPGVISERIALVSLGKEREFDEKAFRTVLRAGIKCLRETGATDAAIFLTEIQLKKRSLAWRIRQATQIALDSAYRFDDFKSKKDENKRQLKKIIFAVDRRNEHAEAEEGVLQGNAIAQGMALTRNLGNLPPNVCTPTYLAEQAKALAKEFKLGCEVLEKKDMEKLGMHSLLAVAKGSHQPPKLIVLHYKGSKAADKPVVLVGKGITFDTGGISLKPAPEMDEMKYDMCGAASVLGTMRAVAGMKLPINLTVVVPTTENMPGGGATRPGDIVTSMSGQTIEILNTDAEGRLILCDALTYSERFEPDTVIDVATLTGACLVALGNVASGLLSNHEPLARELLHAGEESGDRAWQLPLWDDYQDQLKSPFADMGNIGGKLAGTITAACFLSRFTKKFDWAHLDIAGTAWNSGANKGATGRPVPLLTYYLMKRAGKLN